jgi:hypothetical protein
MGNSEHSTLVMRNPNADIPSSSGDELREESAFHRAKKADSSASAVSERQLFGVRLMFEASLVENAGIHCCCLEFL